jgi:hypothetical protein
MNAREHRERSSTYSCALVLLPYSDTLRFSKEDDTEVFLGGLLKGRSVVGNRKD